MTHLSDLWTCRRRAPVTPLTSTLCDVCDQVKGAATLPALPNDRLLMQRLQPSYNVLSNIGRRQAHGQPLYAVTGIQRTAAEGFLQARC